MNATGTITMTLRELERVKVIEAVIEGRLRWLSGCSSASGRSSRLCRRYEACGPADLVSGRRGRPGNRKLDEGLA